MAPEHRAQGVLAALIDIAVGARLRAGADYTDICHGANNPLSSSRFPASFGFASAWGAWERHNAG